MPEDLYSCRQDELLAHVHDLLRDREETARKLGRLTENLRALDARLLTVENSRLFRALQRVTRPLRIWGAKGRRYAPPALAEGDERQAYRLWLERKRSQEPGHEWINRECRNFEYVPRFSLLLHIDKPQRERLLRLIGSVRTQTYPHWDLCACDDASSETWVSQDFRVLVDADARFQYVRSDHRMGSASSLNRAGMLGGGDYVACIGQGDQLAPNALFHLAQALQSRRYDVLYGDHDWLNADGSLGLPVFKPDWSPDLLMSTMYLGRFFAVARSRMDQAGWFRQATGAACLYDMALRLAEKSDSIARIPKLLSSEAAEVNDREGHREALQAAIQRRDWQASLDEAPDGAFSIRRKLSGTPLVSIIICSRNAKLLRKCLRAIDNRTAYPVIETVVVQHQTGDDRAMDRTLARSHRVRVTHTGPFDFASMNNRGAQAASGEVLVFLNDDVEPLSADWLNELLAQVQRPEIGVVGARLLYPSGAIQHVGIALALMDGAGHPHRGTLGQAFWRWSRVTRNVSAVTGACLAIRRRVFEELGGFDACFPVNYNDVDLCLRARRAGYEVICETSAVLRHLESRTREQGISWQERELFYQRWSREIEQGDPYYSPNLTRTKEDCSLNNA